MIIERGISHSINISLPSKLPYEPLRPQWHYNDILKEKLPAFHINRQNTFLDHMRLIYPLKDKNTNKEFSMSSCPLIEWYTQVSINISISTPWLENTPRLPHDLKYIQVQMVIPFEPVHISGTIMVYLYGIYLKKLKPAQKLFLTAHIWKES